MSDVAPPQFTDEQRLAFGRVAELYHRWRPSYPAAAVNALLDYGALGAGATIVEVGAGTGKATELLAQRGLDVLAIEPSAAMAQVARANCAQHPGVAIVETEFERWTPDRRRAALVSAAAWHWLDPDLRYAKAHAALTPGAMLAAVWSFPDWARCDARDRLRRVYRECAPQLSPDFPMHPESEPTRLAGHWEAEIDASGRFTAPETRAFAWPKLYAAEEYAWLLQTHQDHILLSDAARQRLLEAIRRCIDDAGGTLELPLVTYVCLARSA